MKANIGTKGFVALGMAMVVSFALAAPQWTGAAGLQKWRSRTHQCKTEMKGTTLAVECTGHDGHIYSEAFSIPAKATHEVVIRARGNRGGTGEIYWMEPGKGATSAKRATFAWIGDGKWHDYRIRPWWQAEKRIGGLRIDMPAEAVDGGRFEIASVAIEESGPVLGRKADDWCGVMFSLSSPTAGEGQVKWAGGGRNGISRRTFTIPGDGKSHRYYLELFSDASWRGTIDMLELELPKGVAKPSDFVWVKDDPLLPADLVFARACAGDHEVRAGMTADFSALVHNLGGCAERGVRVTVSAKGPAKVDECVVSGGAIDGGASAFFNPRLRFPAAGEYEVLFRAETEGGASAISSLRLKVLPSLGLGRHDYVPEPVPAKTSYRIGALYYPGWEYVRAWDRIRTKLPERRPLLGWYDETNPEVVDWQIKWLVEHGITELYVDWYWHLGHRHHEHWINAFRRARYRKHLKWAMMWANHTPSGSHTVEDQIAVTKYWIENYFNMPEYLTIDGKPVVWIWQGANYDRDLGAGGCRKMLELSRKMAVEAGYNGIHFIAMKWPENVCTTPVVSKFRDLGFDMTGIYHFMAVDGEGGSRVPFSAVADANVGHWKRRLEAGTLPFLPNLSTGWDDRPWNNHYEIYGKNAADFRRICVEAKKFVDGAGIKRLCLSPLNEWGEGSYAEPNAEHGFGFYQAVRDVFCERPAAGWPVECGPKDVGLGPYDLPPVEVPEACEKWNFNGGMPKPWRHLMGVSSNVVVEGGTRFFTINRDPAIIATFPNLGAKDYPAVKVRMRTTEGTGGVAIFWARNQESIRGQASMLMPLKADGKWHDYVFNLRGHREWRGRIGALRFDPCQNADVSVDIASIEFVRATVPPKAADAQRAPSLGDVRLGGPVAAKMNAFIQARMTSEFAQKEVFGEARSAFERRDDDELVVVPGRKVGGLWRGEFWGKLMIGTARVADYLRDPQLLKFVREECHRMIALEDLDGYLGSYADKENVYVGDDAKPAMAKVYGWNTNWNLWNRKYCMWGMLMAYKATGDRAILDSVVRQMDQLIDMMHRLKLPLFVCGHPEKVGLPPMSLLKPLLMLYTETGSQRYLDYADEIVRDWDRDDGACPNFLRNYASDRKISTWYPRCTQWAKTYEMLSCLDGLLEYHRVTGDRRSLEAVAAIRDNILKNEDNHLGGVGYCDQLHEAAKRVNSVSEVCDAVHWIRLNLDLFLITGENRYLDAMEVCYFNNFLAGVFRDGTWCAFAVRGHVHHECDRQCGYAYNHCCMNNVPRTWMDMATAAVTIGRDGVFHVNLYQDAKVALDGVGFEISGNYPVKNTVTVKATGLAGRKVVFRKPSWCPKMDDASKDADGSRVYTLVFDMNPRIVDHDLAHDPDGDDPRNWIRTRYNACMRVGSEVQKHFRTDPAATVMWGPIILAKSLRTGSTRAELANPFTVNLKGYSLKATPVENAGVWGAWELEFSKPGETTRRVRACDWQSAGDDPYSSTPYVFSIWF